MPIPVVKKYRLSSVFRNGDREYVSSINYDTPEAALEWVEQVKTSPYNSLDHIRHALGDTSTVQVEVVYLVDGYATVHSHKYGDTSALPDKYVLVDSN